MDAFEIVVLIVIIMAVVLTAAYFTFGYFLFLRMFLARNRKIAARGSAETSKISLNQEAQTALAEFENAKRLFLTRPISGSIANLDKSTFALLPQTLTLNIRQGKKSEIPVFAYYFSHTDYAKNQSYKTETKNGAEFKNAVGNKWVILLHGLSKSGLDNYKLAYQFMKNGYNIISPDLSGHGMDKRKYIGYGYLDICAINKWIGQITALNKDAQILICGTSMGASTALLLLKNEQSKNVKCIVSDSSFSSLYEECKIQLKNHIHIPSFFIAWLIRLIVKIKLGYDIKKQTVEESVQSNPSKIPILIIHGQKDRFVDVSSAYKLYNASKENTICSLKIFENSAHAESMVLNYNEYFEIIDSFLLECTDNKNSENNIKEECIKNV